MDVNISIPKVLLEEISEASLAATTGVARLQHSIQAMLAFPVIGHPATDETADVNIEELKILPPVMPEKVVVSSAKTPVAPPVAPPVADAPNPPKPPVVDGDTDISIDTSMTERIQWDIEAYKADPSTLPPAHKRPYPAAEVKRVDKKVTAYNNAVEASNGEAVDAKVAIDYFKLMLTRAKRNLSRVKNIPVENDYEKMDKNDSISMAEIDINHIQLQIKVAESDTVEVDTATIDPPPVVMPVAGVPVPVEYDTRDLPEGYYYADGTVDTMTYASQLAVNWTIELLLEHGHILPIPAVAVAAPAPVAAPPVAAPPVAAPPVAAGAGEVTIVHITDFINTSLMANTEGLVRDMNAITSVISKYTPNQSGQLESIPTEQLTACLLELNTIELIEQ